MITDVVGRVRNVQLPASKPLLPLFEAINNSIQSIEDAQEKQGLIRVKVIRDSSLFSPSTSPQERQHAEITGFVVIDNGIGFNAENYQSFQTSDSTYKAKRGGKGIGRFMWLAAFQSVNIESSFFEKDKIMKRSFRFTASEDGISEYNCTESSETQRKTIVELKDYKDKYRIQCPKRSTTLAAYIVEEFLDVFLGPNCPKIILVDSAAEEDIDLDEFYEHEMVAHSEKQQIEIKNEIFELLHIRLYSTHIPEHRLYFCAHERVVTREKLTGIPNLSKKLEDLDGKEFIYAAYINSSVLNSGVNADRTGFNVSEDNTSLYADDITMSDIRKAVRENCIDFLNPYTSSIAIKKKRIVLFNSHLVTEQCIALCFSILSQHLILLAPMPQMMK